MKAQKVFIVVFVGLLVMFMSIGVVAAASSTIVITENDITRQAEGTPPTNNWVLYTRNAGTAVFRSGPATPPLGIGSLELTTPTGADKVYLFNYDHIGTRLDTINAISYATYRAANPADNNVQLPALNIEVDFNGAAAGGYTTLVFEPVYNTSQGAILDDTWQTWDAYKGGQAIWWSSRPIPGVCAFSCYVTWNTILANNPEATILGGFGINQGSGNPALTGAVDALTLGYAGNTTIYNFEPYRVAESANDCKNGGWQTAKRADGSSFKNQGDCMQYVNTGK